MNTLKTCFTKVCLYCKIIAVRDSELNSGSLTIIYGTDSETCAQCVCHSNPFQSSARLRPTLPTACIRLVGISGAL